MKKLFLLLLFLIMIASSVLMVSSCGDDEEEETPGPDSGETENEDPSPDENPEPEEPGNEENPPVASCEHKYNDKKWTTEKEPTRTEEGSEKNTCTLCGEKTSRPIPKITVEELKIIIMPKKLNYFTNEKFSTKGLLVEARYTDGTSEVIYDYEIDKTDNLSASDEAVTVSYGGKSVAIPITVINALRAELTDLSSFTAGSNIYVEGYCAGYYFDGEGNKIYLLRDKVKEKMISLSGVPYEEGYEEGDEIGILANLVLNNGVYSLAFSEANKNKASTVISIDNELTYYFNGAEVVKNAEELSALFENPTLKENSFVTIIGNFYIIKVGDSYRIHMNPSAKSESETLTGGKSIVIVDDSLDASWLESKVSLDGAQSYPGVLVTGIINAMYSGVDADFVNICVQNANWMTVSLYDPDMYEYVIEMAYAYKYQGSQIDYDQYNKRRNENASPEEATEEERVFLDCSSYVNAVYYNAFGLNVLPYDTVYQRPSTLSFANYAKQNKGNADVYAYYENTENLTAQEKAEILQTLKAGLQVGDVLVYRRYTGNGHALIYVGDGIILHCSSTTGSFNHNANNPLESYDRLGEGDIYVDPVENLFDDPTSSKYLFSDLFENFTILRPLARGLTPTEQMECRMTIPGLSIEKSVSASIYSAVFTGDTITYTVTLVNNGAEKLCGVTINEFVPNGTVFVSGSDGVIASGENITWIGDVDAGETLTVTYSVMVTSTEKGLIIASDKGNVNGLLLNKVSNTLCGVSEEKMNEIIARAQEYIAERKSFDDPIELAKALYKDVFGIDIFSYETVSSALLDIIDTATDGCNPDAEVNAMVLENLSGGYSVIDVMPYNNDRVRSIHVEYLSVGDVIMAKHTNSKKQVSTVLYVYLGESNFISVNSPHQAVEIDTVDEGYEKNILVSLYSYDFYAILRPSMVIGAE